MENISKLARLIKSSKKIVVLTGAGISTSSGIPDIRGKNGAANNLSLKEKYHYGYETIVSNTFFLTHTHEFYDYYKNEMIFKNAKPNKAHLFLTRLGEIKDVTIITQNIDGLHQKAGSSIVYELHGNVHRNYCENCGRYFGLDYVLNHKGVPHCDKCGSRVKPDVVLYEESLDEDTIGRSISAIMTCDVLIVVGTSLTVYPAANLIKYAHKEIPKFVIDPCDMLKCKCGFSESMEKGLWKESGSGKCTGDGSCHYG